jgi:hypothetical protein
MDKTEILSVANAAHLVFLVTTLNVKLFGGLSGYFSKGLLESLPRSLFPGDLLTEVCCPEVSGMGHP